MNQTTHSYEKDNILGRRWSQQEQPANNTNQQRRRPSRSGARQRKQQCALEEAKKNEEERRSRGTIRGRGRRRSKRGSEEYRETTWAMFTNKCEE